MACRSLPGLLPSMKYFFFIYFYSVIGKVDILNICHEMAGYLTVGTLQSKKNLNESYKSTVNQICLDFQVSLSYAEKKYAIPFE